MVHGTRPVVLHVVIRPKTDPILDDQGGRIGNFELKPIVSDISGRKVSEFGTVRPRVQIPGPRPISCSSRLRRRRGERSAEVPTAQSLNRTIAIARPDMFMSTNPSPRYWNMTTTR